MENHPPFVTVTSGMSGYFAVMLVWKEEGFYEPWTTGFGRYASKEDAAKEGKHWAEDEELEYQE